MAIYHLTVKTIGRNEGRSAVAAAAYRAGECLVNQYDGLEHDFTRKGWIEHKEILLPEYAPKEYADRNTLWNAVELAEKSVDARLAREFEIALPIELTREQQIEVTREFAGKLVADGMIADICIHNPPVTNDRHQPLDSDGNPTRDKDKMCFRNPHAHILVTVRPLDEKGKWQNKTEKEYLCIKDGEEKGFTATEFREAKEHGWEKQYRYMVGNEKVWLTALEGEKRNLDKVSRDPKSTKHGRENQITARWNSQNSMEIWRKMWEDIVNDKFASIQSEIRIDSRSFKDQGREDEVPTIHMGTAALNMDKRAVRELGEGKDIEQITFSDIGSINKQIREHNRFVRQVKMQMDAFVEKAKDVAIKLASRLESIRSRIIGNLYEEKEITDKYKAMDSVLAPTGDRLAKYESEMAEIGTVNSGSLQRIRELQEELEHCAPHQMIKKGELGKQIKEEQSRLKENIEYQESIMRKYGYPTKYEYRAEKNKYQTHCKDLQRLQDLLDSIKNDNQRLVSEYEFAISETEPEFDRMIVDRRGEFRIEAEQIILTGIRIKYGSDYREKVFESAKRDADRMLKISNEAKRKCRVRK